MVQRFNPAPARQKGWEWGERRAGEAARIKDKGNKSCHNHHLMQGRAPAENCLCTVRARGTRGGEFLALALLQSPNPAQMHLGIYGVLEASSKAQGLFLGLLFSHLFLFILFHHRGPIVGHKNVTGTIGRTRCPQGCGEGRAAVAGRRPAAPIFSPFLPSAAPIGTPHARSGEAFTTLPPSTARPAGPLSRKQTFPFPEMPTGRLLAPPSLPFPNPCFDRLFSSYKQTERNRLPLCEAGGPGAAAGLPGGLDRGALPVRAGSRQEAERAELVPCLCGSPS